MLCTERYYMFEYAGNSNDELLFQTRESGTLRVRREHCPFSEKPHPPLMLSMDFPANPPEPIPDFQARVLSRLELGAVVSRTIVLKSCYSGEQGRSQVFIGGGGASWGNINLSIKSFLQNYKIEKNVLLIYKPFKMC